MSTVEEIEAAIARLNVSEYTKFRQWLTDYDNRQWDLKMASDAAAGRFDSLAREALGDLEQDRCKDL